MSHFFGLMIESLVAVLLLLTIGYCMLLNSRLKRLRADEQSLKATISELITATEIAERAIGGLKLTVRDCDENLGKRLVLADQLGERLDQQIAAGEHVLARLSRIAIAARTFKDAEASQAERQAEPCEAAVKPARANAQSIAAAAQAFTERARGRVGDLAA
ncbi:MAG: chemotaxis protein [Xanthobacteraceae bacterium]|nr:MAG: chemotaxis protein [Xanthobacteraceae bacterium]